MAGNVLQLAGGLVGGAIGSFFGMPGLGFSIGSALFASPTVIKADPGDLTFNYSAYGKFRPFGYGTYRTTAPVCIWSANYVAHKHTEGGKGGGGGVVQEYYTYTRSCAYYLADTDGGRRPIQGIRRIWDMVTGELLYNVGTGADPATIVKSDDLADSITVHTGTSGQTADPLIEAAEGWAPDWAGHAYVVFENLDHGQAKQARVLGFEVVSSGIELTPAYLISTWSISGDPVYAGDGIFRTCEASKSGNTATWVWRTYSLTDGSLIFTKEVTSTLTGGNGVLYDIVLGHPGMGVISTKPLYNGAAVFCKFVDINGKESGLLPYYYYHTYSYYDGQYIYSNVTTQVYDNRHVRYSLRNGFPSSYPDELLNLNLVSVTKDIVTGTVYYSRITSGEIHAVDENFTITDTWAVGPYHGYSVYNGKLITVRKISTAIWEMVVFDLPSGGAATELYTHDLPAIATQFTMAIGGGLALVPTTGGDPVYLIDGHLINSTSEDLSDVITDICVRSGLSADEYDVSLLTTGTVRQEITSQRNARDWLDDFGALYQFRTRDSGGKISFVPKGGSSVATISDAELGMESGPGNVSPPYSASRIQGIDLPRSVTVIYQASDRDYEPGQQSYVFREYPGGQDLTMRTTAVLSDSDALELATISCIEPHIERHTWDTSVGVKYVAIEAGDVITTPMGDTWVKSVNEEGDGVIRLTLQQEASGAYTGHGLPAPGRKYEATTVSLAGPTNLVILDAPALNSTHSGSGFLLAGCGYLSGWDGANVYGSTDDGESYDLLTPIEEASIGYAETALGSPDSPWIWDNENTLTITMLQGTLTNSTESAVRAGTANILMIGGEVLGFVTATALGNNRYTISQLLRGRLGTDWACSTHADNESVVVLSNAVKRVMIDSAVIGAEQLIKAVSFGNKLSDAIPQAFTPSGVSLEPWAPVRIRGKRDSSGNLTITWARRGRFLARPFWTPALNEESEQYQIDIMSGSTVLRTLPSATTYYTTASGTYTTSQMSTDGVTPNTPVSVRVYQSSATVGRGYPGEATI